MTAALLNLGSLVLTLPACVLASVEVGLHVLTTASGRVFILGSLQAIDWWPVTLAVAVSVVAGALFVLFRFPVALPLLLAGTGFGSLAILYATMGYRLDNGDNSDWTEMALGLSGTVLAAVQVWKLLRPQLGKVSSP